MVGVFKRRPAPPSRNGSIRPSALATNLKTTPPHGRGRRLFSS
jgi:hypothetical protein